MKINSDWNRRTNSSNQKSCNEPLFLFLEMVNYPFHDTGKNVLKAINLIFFTFFLINCNLFSKKKDDDTPRNLLALILLSNSSNCGYIQSSVGASKFGTATVTCDSTYGYIASTGIATHTMMNGITGTNLQVPIPQSFTGTNAWKIPLNPAIASSTTSPSTGPIGVAINGVPLFNPCKQEGCTASSGDTKALGELDICNGHAGRSDDYHYHAAPTCLMAGQSSSYWDTHPVGWMLDGFALYGYNDADGTVATRDNVCGGNTKSVVNGPSGYSYHVTDTFPYILSCLRGSPSPDFAGQASKYNNLRNPPVTPFTVSNMTLTLASDSSAYNVLQFTSASTFLSSVDNSTASISNSAGVNQIKYRQLTGTELTTALASNSGKTSCWQFLFPNAASSQDKTFCK